MVAFLKFCNLFISVSIVIDPCDGLLLPFGRPTILFDVGTREEIPDKRDRGSQTKYSSCQSSLKSVKNFLGAQGDGQDAAKSRRGHCDQYV